MKMCTQQKQIDTNCTKKLSEIIFFDKKLKTVKCVKGLNQKGVFLDA